MDGAIKSFAFLLCFIGFNSFAENSCTSIVSNEQQCSFEVPALKHGDSAIVKANNSPLFTGSITAQCRFGVVSLSSGSCAPKSADDCAIPSTSWGPSYNQCSHATQTQTVQNGKTSTINDIKGFGFVTYSCSLGKLTVDDSACAKPDPGSDFDAQVKSQSTVMQPCENNGKGDNNSCLMWANSCDIGVIESGLIEVPIGKTLTRDMILSSTCDKFSFSTMDSYTTPRTEDQTGQVNYYSVRATCSGYTGTEPLLESCGVTTPPVVVDPVVVDPCKGEQVSTLSQVSKICEGSGASQVCYKNTCAAEPADPEACLDCAGSYSFTDSSTGNTCNVSMGGLASELSDTISFENTQFNGVANVSCSNGVASGGGTCFKSCAAGTIVSWKDKNGVSSCGQVIPTNAGGFYKQGDSVTLSTSLDNAGSASATCNNGNWEVTGASCKLSCSGSVAWGSGVDALGRSKSNLCSASTPTVKDGGSTSVSNITTDATGSVGLTCNDGAWSQNNPVCNTSCSAQTVSWGGACQATSDGKSNGQSQYVVHTGNTAHPYPWSISGNATASCSDGKIAVSGTCRYLVSQTPSSWSSFVEESRTCDLSPDAKTVVKDRPFTQTKTCAISEQRSRTIDNYWSDGSIEVGSTEFESQSYTDVTTSLALGTGVDTTPPPETSLLNWSVGFKVSESVTNAFVLGDGTFIAPKCLPRPESHEYPGLNAHPSGMCTKNGEVMKYSLLGPANAYQCYHYQYTSRCEMLIDTYEPIPDEESAY